MGDEQFEHGLIQFYSSQARLLLDQYENINQLLGPTSDWTHPGSHCEILIRELLRRTMLSGMSVDKGFIYGRVSTGGEDHHGPEIDILIHDTTHYAPIFRLNDFVVVLPESVLGIIQVKRSFSSGRDGPLAKGIRQAVEARQHLLDVLVQTKVRRQALAYGGDITRVKNYPEIPELLSRVFSAVVAFDDDTNGSVETYSQYLSDAYEANQKYAYSGCEENSTLFAMPDFVGSLKHVCAASFRRNIIKREYFLYTARHGEAHVGIQILLESLVRQIYDRQEQYPPFAFPKGYQPHTSFTIPSNLPISPATSST